MEMYKHDVISHLPAISIHGYVGGGQIYALWLFMGVRVHVANFYTGQSIGIDETNTFQLKFCSTTKTVGAIALDGLLASQWACHVRVTNLRCVRK